MPDGSYHKSTCWSKIFCCHNLYFEHTNTDLTWKQWSCASKCVEFTTTNIFRVLFVVAYIELFALIYNVLCIINGNPVDWQRIVFESIPNRKGGSDSAQPFVKLVNRICFDDRVTCIRSAHCMCYDTNTIETSPNKYRSRNIPSKLTNRLSFGFNPIDRSILVLGWVMSKFLPQPKRTIEWVSVSAQSSIVQHFPCNTMCCTLCSTS